MPSKTWIFREAGSIPGIPGTYAGVTVVVDDNNVILSVTPLEPLVVADDAPTAPLAADTAAPIAESADVPVAPEQAPDAAVAPVKRQKEGQ